jgi:hypothetical protein
MTSVGTPTVTPAAHAPPSRRRHGAKDSITQFIEPTEAQMTGPESLGVRAYNLNDPLRQAVRLI